HVRTDDVKRTICCRVAPRDIDWQRHAAAACHAGSGHIRSAYDKIDIERDRERPTRRDVHRAWAGLVGQCRRANELGRSYQLRIDIALDVKRSWPGGVQVQS